MKNLFFISPMRDPSVLGDVMGVQRVKPWVDIAIAGASALIGAASAIFGGTSSAKANKRAREAQAAQAASNQAWYNRRYNEDYLDTAAGQNMLKQAKDYAVQNWKKAQGASAVGGGTDAATAQAKEAGNKVVENTMGNIAAQDTARKMNLDNQYRQMEQNDTNARVSLEQQQANNISTAAGQASDAVMKGGLAIAGNLNTGSATGKGNPPQGWKYNENGVLVKIS